MALAMHEALTLSKGINLMLFDEVFESLDKENVELVTELIKKYSVGKSIFIITHLDSVPLSNLKILQVTKEKGLSNYKYL